MVLPNVNGHWQIFWGPEKYKRKVRRNLPLLTPSLIKLGHLISNPPPEIYTISSPGSQASIVQLNYTNDSLGSPACRQQVVGLVSCHDLVSQFLKINLHK